jgi:hypothetical protein
MSTILVKQFKKYHENDEVVFQINTYVKNI